MNVIREINRINEHELNLNGKGSWHDDYKDSAYIFAGGLPFELTEGDVLAIFSQFGEIVDVNLPKDKETHKPRGFAFVMYEDQRSTVLAVDNMNGGKVLGRTIRVDHCRDYKQPGSKDEEGNFQPPEAPSMNALPVIKREGDESDSSDEEEVDDEDPMAAYIRSQKSSKKRKHEGESKEERKARKAAKKAKKEGKGKGKGREQGEKGREVKREVKSESGERERAGPSKGRARPEDFYDDDRTAPREREERERERVSVKLEEAPSARREDRERYSSRDGGRRREDGGRGYDSRDGGRERSPGYRREERGGRGYDERDRDRDGGRGGRGRDDRYR